MPRLHPIILWSFILLALTAFGYAAPFEAPADKNPPFRRDLLPIDAHSMAILSADLRLLVSGNSMAGAAARRGAAQSLALALAVDPANELARQTIAELASGEKIAPAPPKKLTEAKARIWQLHAWLKTPEAGPQGNLLGSLIGDVASALDPAHPAASVLISAGQSEKWAQWIAPLSAFEENTVPENDTDPFVDIEPKVEARAAGKPSFVLTEGRLNTVLFTYDEATDRWILRPTFVEMKASPKTESPFEIIIASSGAARGEIEAAVIPLLRNSLEKFSSKMPTTGLLNFTVGEGAFYSSSRNGMGITGPSFLLANSALTGQKLDATVIAALDGKGGLTSPPNFWKLLAVIQDAQGGRLVVPAGTEAYFTALLTLEKPEFFFNYEVLTAATPQEFMDLCSENPPEKYATALANFRAIREKAVAGSAGTYLANRFVRQRLEEIATLLPNHLSAKMLVLQSSGKRPRFLEKEILAAEILRILTPLQDIMGMDFHAIEEQEIVNLEPLYDEMRAGFDSLERYAGTKDKELVTEAKEVASNVRALSRELRSRTADVEERFQSITTASRTMVMANKAFVQKIATIAGDPSLLGPPNAPEQ